VYIINFILLRHKRQSANTPARFSLILGRAIYENAASRRVAPSTL
jgi:hypothetical protein